MKQLSLAVKREISVFPFSLITAACWWLWSGCSFGPLSHSREQAAAEPNTQTSKPGFDWKSEIQALDQLLSKSVLFLGMVTGCLKLRKKKMLSVTHDNPNMSPGQLFWDPTHKIREHHEKLLKFSPDNKMTSDFPQTSKWLQLIFALIDCFRVYL